MTSLAPLLAAGPHDAVGEPGLRCFAPAAADAGAFDGQRGGAGVLVLCRIQALVEPGGGTALNFGARALADAHAGVVVHAQGDRLQLPRDERGALAVEPGVGPQLPRGTSVSPFRSSRNNMTLRVATQGFASLSVISTSPSQAACSGQRVAAVAAAGVEDGSSSIRLGARARMGVAD